MKLPLVYIVILNWKNVGDTLDCLKSLEQISYNNYKIALIDNNSCDGSVELISDWLKSSNFSFDKNEITDKHNLLENIDFTRKCQLIVNNENSGFAKGNNIGIDLAIADNTDYVLLLNNDTIVIPNFLDLLISHKLKFPEYSVLTPQIRLEKNRDIIWNCGGKFIYGGFWKKYYYDRKNISEIDEKKPIKPITFVTGCAVLFDPFEVGKLTEDFFFGEEDFEFSLRLRKQNKKIGCVMESIIYHKVGNSLEKVNTIGKRYINILNRLVNTRRNNFNIFWPFLAIAIVAYNFVSMLRIERLSLKSACVFSLTLLKEGSTLSSVSQKKFIETLYHRKW